jgi:predicted oxidoreductase
MTYTPAQTLPLQAIGRDGQLVSRIALGCMGLSGTRNPAAITQDHRSAAIRAFEAALDSGITLFDHADIYGGGGSEEIFRDCLAAVPDARQRIVIATKGGIRAGYYDLSAHYITGCVEQSLARLGIEYIDLYQLHRPDPLTHPGETADALNDLLRRGLIRSVGVSNYYPEQVRALQHYLDTPLRSNQIEVSLIRLDPIYEGIDGGDGTLDQCMAMGMTPLAWAPLGGGGVLSGSRRGVGTARLERVRAALVEIAPIYGATPAQTALAWLLAHPAGILPLVGSTNAGHIREAAAAAKLTISREDWYRLWVAARGDAVP